MDVHVHHVGSASPAVISPATGFTIDADGHLCVQRGGTVVAQFAATKWSSAIKVGDIPAGGVDATQ